MEQGLELVQKAKAGNVEAFFLVVSGSLPDLYRFALYTLKNIHDAEDVVSDTVADAWKGIRGFGEQNLLRRGFFAFLPISAAAGCVSIWTRRVELPLDLAGGFQGYLQGYGCTACVCRAV